MLPALSENKAPTGYLTVVCDWNPFSQAERLSAQISAGGTLQDAIDRLIPKPEEDIAGHLSVFVDGDFIFREHWKRVRPKAGSTVYIKVTLQDPVTLIAIFAPIAAESIVAAIGLTGLAATVATAVISFALVSAASALFGPSQPQRSQIAEESPSFSITGARNRLALFEPVPSILGTHKFVPPYGAAPYTEIVGNEQYLRFVVVWGYGPVSVSDVRIGNTPIGSFSNVEVENDFDGTATNLGLYPSVVSQENLSIRMTTTHQVRRTTIDCDELGITLTFPGGLYRLEGQSRANQSVTIDADYRKVGAGSWTALTDATVTDATGQAKRVSYRATGLSSGAYDVRVRRTNDEQALTNTLVVDRLDWTALRAFDTTGDPVELAGVAKSAYRIKATDQLNGVVDQLNAVVSTKIPTWNGSSWTGTSATSNPAAIFRYVLTGAPNKNPTSNVNDAGLGAWYDFCTTKGLKFDQPIDYRRSIRDLLADIANAGMASPSYTDDKWTVIIEKPRTTVIQHFTPRNTKNFSGRVLYPEVPHGMRIRFFNKNKGYREDERIVYDDGFTAANATDFQVVDLPGQTDPANVYKLGRHYIAAARLRPEEFSFDIDIEYLVATRGDLCRLTHDVPSIGQTSGRIKSVAGNDLTLDQEVTLLAATTHTIRVRLAGGTTATATVTNAGAQTTTTSITVSDATGMAAGDLFMFGDQNAESLEVLIRSIEYMDNLEAHVVCVPYSPTIYNASNTIPAYTSLLSDPVSASFIGPASPTILGIFSDESALQSTSQGSIVPAIIVEAAPGAAAVSEGTIRETAFLQGRFRRTGSDDPYTYSAQFPVDSRQIILQPVITGNGYDVEVRATDAFGGTSAWVKIVNHVVSGALAPPPALTSFSLNTIGDHTFVEWEYTNIPIDVTGYEIRYSPDQNNTSWQSMTPISGRVPREARSFTVPSRSGSYAIKAIDILENRSPTALYINSSLEDPAAVNVVDTSTEDPTFSGTKTNTVVIDSKLQLDTSEFMSDWSALTDVVTMSWSGLGDGLYTEGFYEFGQIDLGEVYTSRVTADTLVGVLGFTSFMAGWGTLNGVGTLSGGLTGDEAKVELQVAYDITDSASPTFGAWRRFVVGDYTARHFKFRARLTSMTDEISPLIETLAVTIDMPDRITNGDDIASGAALYSAVFSPAFRVLKNLNITAQNMQTGDFYEISNKTRTGFDIVFKNSSGTAVDRTFDYQAIGYGRERGT